MNKHSSTGKRRRVRRSKPTPTIIRLGDSVQDFVTRTGISRPTAYRMMADGRLQFIQVTDDLRGFPQRICAARLHLRGRGGERLGRSAFA